MSSPHCSGTRAIEKRALQNKQAQPEADPPLASMAHGARRMELSEAFAVLRLALCALLFAVFVSLLDRHNVIGFPLTVSNAG
jgi:hypothetical protein